MQTNRCCQVGENMSGSKIGAIVPVPIPQLVSKTVLAMSRLHGYKVIVNDSEDSL